ncbi:MAG: amidohydrolase family protein [Candidatus Hodarchaeota archaeon]
MTQKFDLLIRNGNLIDGTGNPYYKADIGIINGQIAHIGKNINPTETERVIDANGSVVSPGFFDAHSHDELSLLINPRCDEKILQGVTTNVICNCGFSPAPISEEHRKDIDDSLKSRGGELVKEELKEIYSFDDYLRKLEAVKPGINILPLVGHSTVRIAVMGSANRAPTDFELSKMKQLVANAMEEGAIGMSTGLILVPGTYAESEEIIELSKVVSKFNGIYTSHIRSEGDFEIPAITEAIRVGKVANVPVQISHHKVMGKQNWGKSTETLKMMGEARAKGVEITCDQYPYDAGSTRLAVVLPPEILADGPEVYSRKLRNPKVREALIAEIEKGKEVQWDNFIRGTGFENIFIAVSPNHHNYIGRSISEIADKERKNPYDLIFDLVAEEKQGVIAIFFMMHDDDIERIMRSPLTMIGTDGIPGFGVNRVHPRITGTFPRVLGRYVREKGVLGIEEAIRKMTSLPAQTFKVKRKGLLQEGFDADIVIFDPEKILDRSSYDEPQQKPEGISYVLVNGEIAVENGEVTGASSGKVLRHKNI